MAKQRESILGLLKSIQCKLDFIRENCTVCMSGVEYPKPCKPTFTLNIYKILKELEDKVDFISENCFGCDDVDIPVELTAFSSSEAALEDPCIDLPIEATVTYYHDGEGALPVDGDLVYEDEAGTIPLASANYSTGTSWYSVLLDGTVSTDFNCL